MLYGDPRRANILQIYLPAIISRLADACGIRWQMVFSGTGNKFYIRNDKNTNDKMIVGISFYGVIYHIGISIIISTFGCTAGRAALTASNEPPGSVPRSRR